MKKEKDLAPVCGLTGEYFERVATEDIREAVFGVAARRVLGLDLGPSGSRREGSAPTP